MQFQHLKVFNKTCFLSAQFSGVITPLGRLISSFPVHPLYGKMIAEATNHGNDVTAYIIAIVAALTVQVRTKKNRSYPVCYKNFILIQVEMVFLCFTTV